MRRAGTVSTPGGHGLVTRLHVEEGFGYLETPLGRELRFTRKDVVEDGFDLLALGDEVTFEEQSPAPGPTAGQVKRVPHPSPPRGQKDATG